MAERARKPDVYPDGSVIVLTQEEAAAAIAEARADEDDDEEIKRDLDELDGLLAVDDMPTREQARRQALVTAGAMDQASDQARAAVASAKKRDVLGFWRGLKKIVLTPDLDQWNGCYVVDGDRIKLQAKLWAKGDREQVRTILHEFGHRGRYHAGAELFERFVKLELATLDAFRRIANDTHLEDYARTGTVDGLEAEVFAESYARACLGMPLPERLRQFWKAATESGNV